MRLILRVSTSWLRPWRQLVCGSRGHGTLRVTEDRLAIACDHCGYASPGLDVDSRAIRYALRWERHRIRFHQQQQLRRNGRRQAG